MRRWESGRSDALSGSVAAISGITASSSRGRARARILQSASKGAGGDSEVERSFENLFPQAANSLFDTCHRTAATELDSHRDVFSHYTELIIARLFARRSLRVFAPAFVRVEDRSHSRPRRNFDFRQLFDECIPRVDLGRQSLRDRSESSRQ